ncbi:hypothetical protein ABTQ33_03590 [Paucilactobacillus suebicus]|uniref:Uncharacterized protein n=1 Tax=Paucilactobacillus suebicus DSM 5007 = KCTC 3549 TaxID=1423807 RepID=A0A0R1W604_9LACO|nr:hypothetical protein [Paucilactobacillus suebicus]KRM13328.1 hypothetical protein FD16_GL000803 [Paucilactobacillus suebicus DSM 5007 = KCTC 3549]
MRLRDKSNQELAQQLITHKNRESLIAHIAEDELMQRAIGGDIEARKLLQKYASLLKNTTSFSWHFKIKRRS